MIAMRGLRSPLNVGVGLGKADPHRERADVPPAYEDGDGRRLAPEPSVSNRLDF
jgi:hypothetical protein